MFSHIKTVKLKLQKTTYQ